MINPTLALDKTTIIECSKFKAFDCLAFISNLIKYLPEKTTDDPRFTLGRQFAESFIMMIMDTGKKVKAVQWKDTYNDLLNGDYFVTILQTVFISVDRETQESIKNELLALYTYNSAPLDATTEQVILNTPQRLFSALAHAMRYNYNDFFLISE